MPGVSDVLETLIPVVGEALVGKARDEISRLSEDADDPTKKVVLALMAEAVEELGESGLAVAEVEIGRLLNGRPADLDWASPRTASDAVALLQNAERAQKEKAREAIQKAGKVLGAIGAVFLRAAVTGALSPDVAAAVLRD